MITDLKVDASGFIEAGKIFERAGKNAPKAIARALNHTGDKADTQVVRVLTAQTGLKRKVIRRAVKATRAGFGSLSFVLRARGGDVRVQFFGPREGGGGVNAKPWNAVRHYPGAFMKAGWGKRVPFSKAGMAGHVWRRVGKKRFPIEQVKSGLKIPEETVTGASAAIFPATVAADLPARLDHELSVIFSGTAK